MLFINDAFKDSITTKKDLLYLIIFSTSVLLIGIYIAFKVLTYSMKLKYAKWLLQIKRIE